MRVTVVGAGIMGLCTAHALAKAGHRVTVLDQAAFLPNPAGSSVDRHRLIRYAYGGKTGYAAMVADGYAAWDRLWADLGERHAVETGTLALGRGAEPWIADSARDLDAVGVPYRWIEPKDIPARFPPLTGRGIGRAFHTATGGALLADRIVAALVRRLPALGAAVRCDARVAGCAPATATVTMAGGETVAADRLVIAAGPWVPALLPDLAARVTPSRQAVVYLSAPAAVTDRWAGMPMVLDIDRSAGFYAVPPLAGHGLKIGDHRFSLTGDPEGDRSVAQAALDAIVAEAAEQLADVDRYRVGHAKACFYAVAPDERFIVEPVVGRTWVMTGFSGHGFKFGAVMGERMADTLLGRNDPAAMTAWAAGLGSADGSGSTSAA